LLLVVIGLFACLFVCFGGTTQGFMLAKQVLYCLSHKSSHEALFKEKKKDILIPTIIAVLVTIAKTWKNT
jgi:flagellar motor component MotA